jgi:hypothetical protein
MALICTAGPLIEPVSLSELKDMLRIDASDSTQDDVLYSLGVAARSWCETITQRRFVQQSWSLYMDWFPGYIDQKLAGQRVSSPFVSGSNAVLVGIRYALALPYPPVQAVNNFQFLDANGNTTVMTNNTDYVQDLLSQPARLTPPFGKMWPVARVIPNAVEVDYQVGYATPIQVTTVSGNAVLGTAVFTSVNVGQPVSIPGAGTNGGTLNTIIKSVSSGVGTVRDKPQTTLSSAVTGLLVNHGIPAHWELIRSAIKFLVNSWFVRRMPSFDKDQRDVISALLGPATDKRF